jgi:hypothetical protein
MNSSKKSGPKKLGNGKGPMKLIKGKSLKMRDKEKSEFDSKRSTGNEGKRMKKEAPLPIYRGGKGKKSAKGC